MSKWLTILRFTPVILGMLLLLNIEIKGQPNDNLTFWFLEDTMARYELSDILNNDGRFKPLTQNKLFYNITESAIWIKFKQKLKSSDNNLLYLELSTPTIHYLDYFYPNDSSGYSHLSTGFLKKYSTRPILSDHFVFPVNADSNWHYLRLKSGHFLNTDLRITNWSVISGDSDRRHLIYGLYIGILLVIIIIVIVLVLQTKQFHFLFYIGFIVAASTVPLVESGIYFENIWPEHPIFNYLFLLYTFAVSYFILSFLKYAFKANELAGTLFYFNFWVLTVFPVFPTVYFLWNNQYSQAIVVVQISSMLIAFSVLLMTLICFYKSRVFKSYYRLIGVGQVLMVFSVAIYLAAQNQFINLGFYRDFVIMSGGVAEAICFTIAIFIYQSAVIKKYYKLLRKQNSNLLTAVALRTNELEQKNSALVAAMQEKDNLVNIVIHDLRSPLNQTKALGKLLINHVNDAEAMNDMLKRIEQASDHGIKLINELSSISKIEQQSDSIEFEKINLSELVAPLLNNMDVIATQKRIKIDTELNADVVIESYSNYLIRIIENLLSNAIKFSSYGSKIDFSISEQSIRIKDYGPGFTKEDITRAFGKFQRLSAKPTAGESSTGLGLYIVKLLAEKLNIEIELISEPGEGSTFILNFRI